MDNLLRSLQRAAQDLLTPRMLALVLYILAPVYMGLAVTHHGLSALDSSRKEVAA
ncbi:MAG: hypothetical protein P4L70_01315 [Parasulfuritortus sp.]|nr:hypothetical protein [Parasulfuritortus sp.]